MKKITTHTLLRMKENGEKIVCLTAYDFIFASIFDEVGVDLILVGDSSGMVCAGHETTLPVTMDEMIYHASSVRRGVSRALLIVDMPFGSFQINPEKTLENAIRFLKETGVEGVKVEGGGQMVSTIEKLVSSGIPVMGHLGLTPQSVHQFGGFRVQGRTEEAAVSILEDAKKLEDAGVFSIVLEKIPADLAQKITESVTVPTIGIAAGPHCDGQILVSYDMLGLYDKKKFKFVRLYANLADQIRQGTNAYIRDVKAGDFPTEEESF